MSRIDEIEYKAPLADGSGDAVVKIVPLQFLKGIWSKPGVHNVEEFDPDPFMAELNIQGLPWHEEHDGDLEL